MNTYHNLINLTNKVSTNSINRKLAPHCHNTKAAVAIHCDVHNKAPEQRQPQYRPFAASNQTRASISARRRIESNQIKAFKGGTNTRTRTTAASKGPSPEHQSFEHTASEQRTIRSIDRSNQITTTKKDHFGPLKEPRVLTSKRASLKRT